VWRTAVPVLACTAGGDCLKRGDGRVVAFGPHPVLVGGRVLVPVVAALPDIRVRVRGGAVTVTPEGWPGTQLPATAGGAALGLWGPGTPCLPPDQAQPAALPPGAVADLGVCFRNAHGLQLSADRRPAVAFRVPPASPLRLAAPTAAGAPPLAGGGAAAVAVPPTVPLATPYVAVRASAARDLAQGRWALTIRVPGHPPVRWRIRLADHRPYRLQVALAAPPVAGRADTLLVTLRQRDGSLYRPGPGTAGRVCDLSSAAPVSGGPVVEVTGPGGTRTAAPVPAVCSSLPEGATAIGPVLFFQGAAHERFVPPRPGSYRATVTWPGFTLDGAPWSLRPATLDLSAAP
jgi:hypothetical protein